MIIQAGFDLELLARPLIVQEGKLRPRLVVIGLDAEMQLESIRVVSESFEGSLKPFQDAILEHPDLEGTKYFAIAHAGIWVEDDYFDEQPILAEAKQLSGIAKERGLHMIGHFGLDDTGYMSNGPHSYFDQYSLGDDLPSTMTHWVHSRFGRCE
ncbi:hypothetical protein [Arthrobacter sp. MMS18-M83]|uniref:hypothetical protein n=1 Tax=Arthrobacter sp. MMS18-M83 TaxID=2996261 RepID=UPI00227B2B3E|nr:hypothetical protein [Arthrobacter sp. MMS18-M83]WAH95492.1 hypothetical protein OW521_13635 [Arthrobacter sp. MMS18-M83]